MVNIIIPKESDRRHDAQVLQSFIRDRGPTAADRDAAQVIAARTREAVAELKRMEGNRK